MDPQIPSGQCYVRIDEIKMNVFSTKRTKIIITNIADLISILFHVTVLISIFIIRVGTCAHLLRTAYHAPVRNRQFPVHDAENWMSGVHRTNFSVNPPPVGVWRGTRPDGGFWALPSDLVI